MRFSQSWAFTKKNVKWSEIASTLMAGRDRLSEVFTKYIKYIISGIKVVFYWDQPFQPKPV